MPLPLRRNEDHSKHFLNDLPPDLLPALTKFATPCTDLDRGDEPPAACADVATKLVEISREAGPDVIRALAEKCDDGAGSLRRDGKS